MKIFYLVAYFHTCCQFLLESVSHQMAMQNHSRLADLDRLSHCTNDAHAVVSYFYAQAPLVASCGLRLSYLVFGKFGVIRS